ncbi:MAG: DUF4382 domain-containing protein [Rhodothermales bacterium]
MYPHTTRLSVVLAAILLVAAGLTGCDSNDSPEVRMSVLLTDAPLDDVLEANVSIDRVELLDSTGTTTILMDEPVRLDLLKLRDGITTELANLPVLAGAYRQIRFIVGDSAFVLLSDSTMEELKIPSGETTGIKLMDLPTFELDETDDLVTITIDFDAEKSFLKAGNSGKYIFKPVLKPISIEIDGEMIEVPADSTQG